MSEPYGPDETLSKLERMKLFAQLLVRALSEEDFLGIVTFGTHADVVFPLTRMSEHEKVRRTVRGTILTADWLTCFHLLFLESIE